MSQSVGVKGVASMIEGLEATAKKQGVLECKEELNAEVERCRPEVDQGGHEDFNNVAFWLP